MNPVDKKRHTYKESEPKRRSTCLQTVKIKTPVKIQNQKKFAKTKKNKKKFKKI